MVLEVTKTPGGDYYAANSLTFVYKGLLHLRTVNSVLRSHTLASDANNLLRKTFAKEAVVNIWDGRFLWEKSP